MSEFPPAKRLRARDPRAWPDPPADAFIPDPRAEWRRFVFGVAVWTIAMGVVWLTAALAYWAFFGAGPF